MGNWLSIAVIIFLGIMILYGHYRGFIRLAVSGAALIATLIIVQMAMPQITGFIKAHTGIYQSLESGVQKTLGMESDVDIAEPSLQRNLIESMSLPGQLKEALLENNNSEVYQVLGVETFQAYVASYLANSIFNTLGFLVMYALVFTLLHILTMWLNLVARLPVISGMNKLAGAALGAVEGIFILWFLGLLLSLFAGTHLGQILLVQIEASSWLSYIYNNNFLGSIIMVVVKNIL